MTCGSWGIELWDQGENVLKYFNDQISSTDAYYRLFTELQKVQYDAGKRIRKIASNFQRKKAPTSDENTYDTSLYNLLETLSAFGTDIEESSKTLGDDVMAGFKRLLDRERESLDKSRASFAQLSQNLDQVRKRMESNWHKYASAYKDKQKAYENLIKGEKELPHQRIEQLKEIHIQKCDKFEHQRAHYAAELNKYNNGLRQHYNKGMVGFLENLSLKSRHHVEETKKVLEKMTVIYECTNSKLADCIQSMKDAVATLDAAKDDELMIKQYKTGQLPPVDLPFLDLEHCSVLEGSFHALGAYMLGLDASQNCPQLPGSLSTGSSSGMLGGFKFGSSKSNEGIANLRSPFICDLSTRSVKDKDLTIIQLCDRMRDVADQIKRTESEIGGLQHLLDAYRNNPTHGSADNVTPEIGVLERRLYSLRAQADQLQQRFEDLGGEGGLRDAREQMVRIQSCKSSGAGNRMPVRSSNLDSDNSFDSDTELPPSISNSNAGTPPPNAVGYAVMKYGYEGSGSLCLAAEPGDFFYVTKLDENGSGWTTVVSKDGTREGLVPTAYIDLTTYPNAT